MAAAAAHIQRLLQETEAKLLASKPRPALAACDYFRQSLLREYKVQETRANSCQIDAIVRQAWESLRPVERKPFEEHAAADRKRFDDEQAIFVDMQEQYSRLKELARAQGVELPPSIQEQQQQQQQQQEQQVASPRHQERALPSRPQAPPQASPPSQQPSPAQQQPSPAQQQPSPAQQQPSPAQQQPSPAQQQPSPAQQQQQQQQQQQPYAPAAQAAMQRVQQLQRQLADLQQQLQQQVAQAAATAAQLPALLQPIYLEQQRQALQAGYQRHRDALQVQLQEAYRQQALAALSAAALQAPPPPQQRAAWQGRQGQQQQQRQQAAPAQQKQGAQQEQRAALPPGAELPPGVPETIEIVCAGSYGTMWVLQQQVACHCTNCQEVPPEKRVFSCPQWELHVGSTSSKKWKASFKVRPGGAPGVPRDGNGMQVGRWLEMNNVNYSRPPTGRLPVDPTRQREAAPKPPLPEKTYTSERILKMQERQRELERQQQLEEEEEGEKQPRRGSGDMTRPPSGSLDEAPAARALKKAPAEGQSVHQLGRRLPGRATRVATHRWTSGPAYRSALAGHEGSRRAAEPRPFGQQQQGGTVKPWNAVLQGSYQPINVRYSGERCCVCDIDSDFDFDQMVTCDCCGIAVHQSCYGIMELPGPDEMWLCRACELREEGKPPPQCCVCPVVGGALKPTSMRGLWCHSACLQWIPELTVGDVESQEPVEGVRSVPKERWDLLCCVCRQRMGAKIQCEACFTAYHPLCARVAGFHMEIRDGPEGPDGPVLYISYCARHANPQPHLSGARLVSESEEQGDLPEQQEPGMLCNGQPYELPDCAPLPDCPAGAARAMPVDRWQRQQHGTGTGASSVAAFWIPGPEQEAELPRKRQRAAGRSGPHTHPAPAAVVPQRAEGSASGGEEGERVGPSGRAPDELIRAGLGVSGGGRGRGRWGGRGGRGRGRGRGRWGGRWAKDFDSDVPPEPVELVPLPEGVSEDMTVWCNGHTARFIVRTQTIVYNGQTISVTRFEALSGKEVAKKWKQSLYSVGPDGEPEQMMQDWLEEHELDRKALEALARNAAQAAAWEEHAALQVGDVLLNIVEAVEEDAREPSAAGRAADSGAPGAAGTSSAAAAGAGASSYSAGGQQQQADSDGEDEQQSGAAAAEAPSGKAGVLPLNGKQLLGRKAPEPQPTKVKQEAPEEADEDQAEAEQWGNASPQQQQEEQQQRRRQKQEQEQRDGIAEPPVANGVSREQDAAAAGGAASPAGALGRSGSTSSLLGRKRAWEGEGAGPAGSEASGDAGPSGSRLHPMSAATSGLQNGKMRRLNSLASVDAHSDAADMDVTEAPEAGAAARQAQGPAAPGRPHSGRHHLVVDVVCGGMQAVFDARTMMVTLPDGRGLSPIEYEKMSGRSASKKWKWSIRVDKGGGVPGATLEDWLAKFGLEAAIAPRARPSMLALLSQRQQVQHGGQDGAAAVPSGQDGTGSGAFRGTMHREGCLCIICKNARRSGRTWAGMLRSPSAVSLDGGGGGSASTAPAGQGGADSDGAGIQPRPEQQQQQGAQSQGGSEGQQEDEDEGGPRVRDGKRAYLRALPQLATAGATRLQLHEVPLSRCWTPEDWAAHRLRQAARAAAREAGDGGALRAADLPPLVAGSGVAAVDSLAPRVSLGPGVADGRPSSLKEKLGACNATEHARIAFGKSGVHGWGLFARLPMAQDSMVAEYRGVLVRASAASRREAGYRAAGRDCYLFNLDDAHVLDATEAGAITRFTNHSCAPSLYTKILNVDGRQRLVFFARHDIEVGQELTYNYRFEREEGEERLPCTCGAPNCSGFLN